MSPAPKPAEVNLGADTIAKFTLRDMVALSVLILSIGGLYWKTQSDLHDVLSRIETERVSNERQDRDSEKLSASIEKLTGSIDSLRVAVGKLETKLEGMERKQ